MIRRFSDLKLMSTFKERFDYLRLSGSVGESTFGFDRYLNQILYRSKSWADIRDVVIIRDNGCDLGILGFEIRDRIIVHHMNVITVNDIESRNPIIFDPEYLICVSNNTHLAIHYSDESLLKKDPIERKSGDTKLWPNVNRKES